MASGPGLGLAVADDAEDDEVRVVERRPVGVAERVAELAALVDAARRLGRHVAADAARERELAEQGGHPGLVAGDVRIDLAVGALEIGVGHRRRSAVPGPDDPDRVQVARPDHPADVGVDEVEPRRRPPVAEQPRLDVLGAERLAEERIGEQVDLSDGQVVGRPPVGVDPRQLVVGQWLGSVVRRRALVGHRDLLPKGQGYQLRARRSRRRPIRGPTPSARSNLGVGSMVRCRAARNPDAALPTLIDEPPSIGARAARDGCARGPSSVTSRWRAGSVRSSRAGARTRRRSGPAPPRATCRARVSASSSAVRDGSPPRSGDGTGHDRGCQPGERRRRPGDGPGPDPGGTDRWPPFRTRPPDRRSRQRTAAHRQPGRSDAVALSDPGQPAARPVVLGRRRIPRPRRPDDRRQRRSPPGDRSDRHREPPGRLAVRPLRSGGLRARLPAHARRRLPARQRRHHRRRHPELPHPRDLAGEAHRPPVGPRRPVHRPPASGA